MKMLALLFWLTVSTVGRAQFTFTTNNGAITLTGYSGTGGNVVIPETTNGWPVVNIGSGAFSNKLTLTSVAIPNNVTNLGTNAFYLCAGLTNVSFGTGLLAIGHGSFYGCKKLPAVTIPDTVRSLGSNVFNQCVSLTNVVIGNAIANLDNAAFQACSNLARVVIPNSVTNLGTNVFYSCASLTNVTLGGNVRNLGPGAFQGCAALPAIVFPGSVTSIGDGTFRGCSHLGSVTVPGSVTNLGFAAFNGCTGLVTAVIGNQVPGLRGTFNGCIRLQNVSIGTNVAIISLSAFQSCGSLTNVLLPAALTNLVAPEFRQCTNLLAINLDPGNPNYSSVDGVVFDKSQTTLVKFPGGKRGSYAIADNITSFSYGVFWECYALTNLEIGRGVTNMDYVPFDGAMALQNINVNPANAVYSSNGGVLFDRNQMTLLRFPPAHATSYLIPAGTTTIGVDAFVFSALIGSVTVPASVTNLQDSVFQFCSNLTAVTFLGNAPPTFGPSLFGGSTLATVYNLPGTVGWTSFFSDRPTALWNPEVVLNNGHSVSVTNQFAFDLTGNSNIAVVVETSANLNLWTPLQSVILTNGSAHFSDPQWTNFPSRYYRLRSP